jgi:hypothetical protein
LAPEARTDPPADTEDLQDSAPLRDFVRASSARHEAGVVALPVFDGAPGAGQAALRSSSAPVFAALVTAATMVLLARHSRRSEVALTFLAAGSPAAACTLSADVSPQRPFADLVQALCTAMAAGGGVPGAAQRPRTVPHRAWWSRSPRASSTQRRRPCAGISRCA